MLSLRYEIVEKEQLVVHIAQALNLAFQGGCMAETQ